MAGINNQLVHRVPGRFILNPTQVGLAATPRDQTATYGGTVLGNSDRVRIVTGLGAGALTADEFGGIPIDYVLIQKAVVVSFLMEGWDEDTLELVFPNTTDGPSTDDKKVIEIPGVNRSGYLLSSDAITLLFAPDNGNVHPGILIPKAIPNLAFAAEARFSIISILSFPCLFQAVRDVNSHTVAIAKIENLENLGWL